MLVSVRRLLAVSVAALAAGAGAHAEEPEPLLTLKAPPATRYGHRIEFVGRLFPAVLGARIRLFRGEKLIATAELRRDGTFRIPVRLAKPGPFRAGWAGIFSEEVTVKIHPLLETAIRGRRVAGSPLTLAARLRPREAGVLRVTVLRDGRAVLRRVVPPGRSLPLGVAKLGRLRVRVRTVPRQGYVKVSRELAAAVRGPLLRLGASGLAVAELARRLSSLHYVVPRVTTTFDADLLQSVYAFQKAQRLPRTGVVDDAFWRRLEWPAPVTPRYRSPADHLEVDKARQILLRVRGGKVDMIVPVSTAGIPGYSTPVGRFAVYRKVAGYDPSPLGVLLNPLYFYGGYAIHGNPSVPPYPASHGCVRVPNYVIYRLFSSEPYGETVYVY